MVQDPPPLQSTRQRGGSGNPSTGIFHSEEQVGTLTRAAAGRARRALSSWGRRCVARGDPAGATAVGGRRGGGGAAGSPGAGGGGGAPRRHGHGYDARPPRLPRLLAPNSGADVAASFRVPAGPPRRRRRQHPGLPGAGAPSPAPAPARLTVNAPRVGARPPGGRELRLVSGARCASRLLLLWSPAPLRPGAPGTESQELRAAA